MGHVYLPLDEEGKVMKIVGLNQEAIVVPLVDFGYPNFHLTIFMKDIQNGQIKLNAHITKDGENTNKTIFEYIFNPKELEVQIEKKFEVVKFALLEEMKKLASKSISKPKEAQCLTCICKNHGVMNLFSSRGNAPRYFEEIRKAFSKILIETSLSHCNDEKHTIYGNLSSGETYFSLGNLGFFKSEDYDNFLHDFEIIMKFHFKEEIEFTESAIERIIFSVSMLNLIK